MKRLILPSVFITALLIICSCNNKPEMKTEYVNPVFKENLTEIFDIMSKRYIVDFSEVKKKFEDLISTEIDSVQSSINELVYDSTFVFHYKKINFHYYKRSTDKKYILTELDLSGEFKAKQFILSLTTTKDEFLALFGNPVLTTADENANWEELTYSLYKDEEGAYYDSFTFIFTDGKFTGIRYTPYVEIYPETNDQSQNAAAVN